MLEADRDQPGQVYRTAALLPAVSGVEARGKQSAGHLLEKIGIIDSCAKEVGEGDWYAAIIQHVCIGKSYEQMDRALMPTSNKNAFFRRRREFFDILNRKTER